MRSFYLAYSKITQAVGQLPDIVIFLIPWGNIAVLLEKIKDEKPEALINGKKIVFIAEKPFDLILNCSEDLEWCAWLICSEMIKSI